MEILESGKRNIVILGAGFGGITALLHVHKRLRRAGIHEHFQLVLVNQSAWQLYTPALYEIAAIPRDEASALAMKRAICIPIDAIVSRLPDAKFIGETVVGLDPERHIIAFASGDILNFEYCVIALGAETNYFGIPGLAERSFPLKSFEDAIRLRNRIDELVRTTTGPLHIIIGGSGATGVEFGSELMNYLCFLNNRKTKSGTCQEEVTLLDGGPEILAGFSPEVIRRAKKRLQSLGIHIRANTLIKSVAEKNVTLADGSELPCDLLVWTGGVKPASALQHFLLPRNEKGRIIVNDHLEARPRIYAVGDCAGYVNPATEKGLPWNIPVAEFQARVAARNIVADIQSQPKSIFLPTRNYPFILTVGGKYALTDLVFLRLFGFLGWIVKQGIELWYLFGIVGLRHALLIWTRTVRVSSLND